MIDFTNLILFFSVSYILITIVKCIVIRLVDNHDNRDLIASIIILVLMFCISGFITSLNSTYSEFKENSISLHFINSNNTIDNIHLIIGLIE